MPNTENVRSAIERARAAADLIEVLTGTRDRAIREALADGMSTRQVAAALGERLDGRPRLSATSVRTIAAQGDES